MEQFNTIIRLRRDNDYNYAKIENTFVPANGEICLVDTAADGLRAVCGDGVSPFGQLDFVDNLVIKAYFFEGAFYKDSEHLTEIQGSTIKIYIDVESNSLYCYDGEKYLAITQTVTAATANVAGIMKLYKTTGDNEDGTITQKGISDALSKKVEVDLDAEQELIIISKQSLMEEF